MTKDDVSVVIPAYNAEKFIVDALESTLNQTHLPREVLIINDGSNDQTFKTIEGWIEKTKSTYPAYTLLTQDNHGLPATRNVGIRRATGRWIALLDADDIWEPNHLSELLAAAAQIPSAVASYGAGRLLVGAEVKDLLYDDFWDSPSRKFGRAIGVSSYLQIDRKIFPRLIQGNFIKPSSLLFDRRLSIDIGLFDTTLRTGEDREFLVRLIFNGNLVYSPVPITQYRWHADNISQTKNAKRNAENSLRALCKITENRALGLNKDELLACRQAIEIAVKEYLYICSNADWRSYFDGLQVVAELFGSSVKWSASSLKDLGRCFVRSILNKK